MEKDVRARACPAFRIPGAFLFGHIPIFPRRQQGVAFLFGIRLFPVCGSPPCGGVFARLPEQVIKQDAQVKDRHARRKEEGERLVPPVRDKGSGDDQQKTVCPHGGFPDLQPAQPLVRGALAEEIIFVNIDECRQRKARREAYDDQNAEPSAARKSDAGMHEVRRIDREVEDAPQKEICFGAAQQLSVIGIIAADVPDHGILRLVRRLHCRNFFAARISETADPVFPRTARTRRKISDHAENEVPALVRRGKEQKVRYGCGRRRAHGKPDQKDEQIKEHDEQFRRKKSQHGNEQRGKLPVFPLRARRKQGIEDGKHRHREHETADKWGKGYEDICLRVIVQVPGEEEHRIQADADLDGGRDIDAAAFLHEDGQADEGKLDGGISGIAEQGKERTAAPEKVHRGGAGEHQEKKARAEDIYDARRFFAEDFFQHFFLRKAGHALSRTYCIRNCRKKQRSSRKYNSGRDAVLLYTEISQFPDIYATSISHKAHPNGCAL